MLVAGEATQRDEERPLTRPLLHLHECGPRRARPVLPGGHLDTSSTSGTTSRPTRRALGGLKRTLLVSAIAIVGAFFIGLVLGAARAHRIPVVSQLAAIYVEIIRNTPILVQIFFLYFGLTQEIGPWPGVRLEAFTVAWLSVMIWGGAFNTENFRAGFEAVPARYREAGFALGFSASRRSST